MQRDVPFPRLQGRTSSERASERRAASLAFIFEAFTEKWIISIMGIIALEYHPDDGAVWIIESSRDHPARSRGPWAVAAPA